MRKSILLVAAVGVLISINACTRSAIPHSGTRCSRTLQNQPLKISADDYYNKVYASWLGQCIGNIYGLPHENQYIDEPGPENFPYGYTGNLEQLEEANGAFSDDDTDIEYMYLLAMEDYGPEPTLAQLAEKWKYHVRDRVWLANRAALSAMHYGYTPPVTGQKGINPHWFQIDPQLINEVWAVTAPGMIDYAADKSGWAAHVMDDSWGIEATIWYGAMYSAAFFESDIEKLIDIGVASLPHNSRFAKTVADMKALYKKYPNDWKKARQEMARKYYVNEPLDTKTIWNANLNGACGVLGMLYGEGDFQKTLDLNVAMGFDCDNQAATIAGLQGIILGVDGIPKDLLYPLPELEWSKPFNDSYKNVTRHDMDDVSIQDLSKRTAMQGEKIILKHGGKKLMENGQKFYLINTEAEFIAPLEFPSGPRPLVEVGKTMECDLTLFGGKPPYTWNIESGVLPDYLRFADGTISGEATAGGVYPITVSIKDKTGQTLKQSVNLIVRGTNLAPKAAKVLANVLETDTAKRDAMWLTVPRSLYADKLKDIIRDGKRLGNSQTFYSISRDLTGQTKSKTDFYGYEWAKPQTIGLLGYHVGSVEEMGGWFNSLNVEYRDAQGEWQPVKGLVISPPLPKLLPPEKEPKNKFNKPNFVEYLLGFKPMKTTAIRMIGETAEVDHWTIQWPDKPNRVCVSHFTSITELSVYGPLPQYELLRP